MASESPADAERPGIGRLLKRRLPLLIVAAVGLWMMSGGAPKETTLVYRLGDRAERLSSLEVQLRKANGKLVRSTQFRFDAARPAPREQPHALSLEPGDYRLEVALRYAGEDGGGRSDRIERSLSFDGEERTVLNLER